jgi:site-specific recombinase XerC
MWVSTCRSTLSTMGPHLLPADATATSPWDQALYAFLVEKGHRSGSRRTVETYSRLLWPFFAALGKPPDRVTPADVLAFAHGVGLSGRSPSPATVGARIACLSSFYRFLIRMRLVTANPCDAVERPRTSQAPARGLSADEVRRLLAVVPDTVAGRRDRAILLTLILTGRRRAEVIGLTAGDLTVEDGVAFYSYRGKGGKRGRRELPRPAHDAICATLADAGLALAVMGPGRLALASRGRRGGHQLGGRLWSVPALPAPGGVAADRAAHLEAQRGKVATRRRRVGRGGQRLPRPQLTGCDHDLPTAARRPDGRHLAAGRRRTRALARPCQAAPGESLFALRGDPAGMETPRSLRNRWGNRGSLRNRPA